MVAMDINWKNVICPLMNCYKTKEETMKLWMGLFLGMIPFLSQGAVQSISSTDEAFAALKSDGSVVAWGNPNKGGSLSVASYDEGSDTSTYTAVSSSLLSSNVSKIFSNGGAFAAVKSDGSVVTWGSAYYGGDSSSASSGLSSGVVEIVGTISSFWNKGAFAARKSDGSVVAWGDKSYGGRLVISHLDKISAERVYTTMDTSLLSSGVTKIVATKSAFAALKDDGSVVTWGDSDFGGGKVINRNRARPRTIDISLFLESGVTDIFSNEGAFAALKDDGSLVTWGHAEFGGDTTWLESELGGLGSSSRVSKVFSTRRSFAAIREDGRLITWGDTTSGGAGDSGQVADQLSGGISTVGATNSAFAAVNTSGGIITWGGSRANYLRDNPVTSGVSQIFTNVSAFAALKSDGSVVTWGSGWGTTINASEGDSAVTGIVSHRRGEEFAALRSDGSVLTWGSGGSPATTFGSGSNISKIFANKGAFAAVKSDGTVVAWGDTDMGGSLTGVSGL